jgi:hypothetical protein
LPIGRGLSNADIAAELFMSVATVKAHLTRVFDKLGTTNRVQVAICVHDAGARLTALQIRSAGVHVDGVDAHRLDGDDDP